jgi:hypothetical protein
MNKTSDIQQILLEFDFDEKWFDLGFVSSEKLYELWADFQTGEDDNKEHYRWRAFTNYLETNNEIGENNLKELYRLGENDTDDRGMGMSMRITILKRKDCPAELVDKALNSNEQALVKAAKRKLGLDYK